MDRWFPVARSAEIVPRHIAQTQLLGQEIALWRSDAGDINAWENRCPHRGVRLSIGINTGSELRCQYHGWRFASGTGQCTLIPAHPTQRPAASVHARVFAVVERYHFVWVNFDPHADAPGLPMREMARDMTLRSIFVNAPAETVASVLLRGHSTGGTVKMPGVAIIDAFTLAGSENGGGDNADTSGSGSVNPAAGATAKFRTGVSGGAGDESSGCIFLLQPVNDKQSVIHGLLPDDVGFAPADWVALLRYHNARMSAARDEVERLYGASGMGELVARAADS